MKRILLTSALALTLTGPAFASDQLARSLGVEPGVYSTAELIALRSAYEDDQFAVANSILNGSATDGEASSNAQFAASVGVDPSFSTADAAALRSAYEEGDYATVNFILEAGGIDENVSVSSKSGISAGRAQLAASLGVNASDYSLAELVELRSVQSSDNGRGD